MSGDATPAPLGRERAGNPTLDFLRRFALLITVVVLYAVFALMEPQFASLDNFFNILNQTAIMGILAVGLTLVVVSGEIDMSFAANAALAAVMCILMLRAQVSVPVVIAATVFVSTVIGIVNSIVIVRLKVPAMLGTIGVWLFVQGVAAWISKGRTVIISSIPESFSIFGRGKIFGVIPVPILTLFVICFLGVMLLNKTVLGRYFYAVGGNKEAAIHAGIDANKIKIIGFIILGFLSGVCGVTIASKLVQATARSGDAYFFVSIIAVFLGSIFLKDGVPNIWGTVVASLFLTVLDNGFNMVGLMWWHQSVAQGLIMIGAIAFITIICKKTIKGIEI